MIVTGLLQEKHQPFKMWHTTGLEILSATHKHLVADNAPKTVKKKKKKIQTKLAAHTHNAVIQVQREGKGVNTAVI